MSMKKKLGYWLVLGFETNNEAHSDYPPHWHLIFRWPYFCGSQAPHFYLDEQGKMTSNHCSIDGIRGAHRNYEKEEWCLIVDMYGNDLLALKIDEDGGLLAIRPNGELYKMLPFTRDGGVEVLNNGRSCGNIRLTNDTASGVLTLDWASSDKQAFSDYRETISYDPLTGVERPFAAV